MSEAPIKKRKPLIRKLRIKYRLVILDENTFAEKFSLRLSRLSTFIWISSAGLLLIALTTLMIAYTPLREFIPGYPDGSERRLMMSNLAKSDSLENELRKYEEYVSTLKVILDGEVPADSIAGKEAAKEYRSVHFTRSAEDSLLRRKVEEEEKYNLQFSKASETYSQDNMYGIFFFTPLEGTLTQSFNPATGHYGIDIVSGGKEAVKATLDGTVIFADWASDGGHEIHIQHTHNLVSVYKHNAVLLKKTGDYVKAGDPVAIVGNSGGLSSGPHLHFELWHKGKAIDPQLFLIL